MRRLPAPFAAVLALVLGASTSLIAPKAAHAQADDWGAGPRDPFDKSVVAKYKGILARNPHDAGALARLLQMYKSYRTLKQLRTEYDAALAKEPTDGALLIIVGRLARNDGDEAAALTSLEAAAKVRADDGALALELGELYKRADRLPDSRVAYDRALAKSTDKKTRMTALRALADLALGSGDIDGAKKYFEQYIGLDPSNVQLRLELGDALLQAGKHDDAIASYVDAEKKLGSDPARKIEVIARIGAAREAKGDDDLAIAEYNRAIKAAPKGYWIVAELTQRVVDIYRRKQKLPDLLALYEKQWSVGSRGHFEWDTLARLYEETGSADKAIEAYKQAVKKSAWELETQRRLIQLLETSGRDDEALAQYEAVVRAAPGEARFQIDLAERYWRRGKTDKALSQIKQLQSRFGTDAGVLSAIADMYMRWGKDDLAMAAFERLVKMEPSEPSHLITLGEQHYMRGEKAKALAVWDKLTARKNAAGYAEHGQVLADHGMPAEALESFKKAVALEPANADLYRKRGQVFESLKRFPDAIADWQKVLSLLAPKERSARREAQRRLVQVVVRDPRQETSFRGAWIRDFGKAPPDADAGFLLSAYYAKKSLPVERQNVLIKLRTLLPTDQDVVTDLVKAYRDLRKYDIAVELLLELAKLDPSREREVYTQIAEIKTEARQDDQAIEWSQKALAKSPSDPGAYQRLAERYVEMQRIDDAIAAYEKVCQLDTRNAKARFELAQLYVQTSQPAKAAELYRSVLRNSTDEESVARAGREAIVLEEATDTLGELEQILAPLSFVLSHKPIYRRILVDLYLRYVPRLVEREQHGDAAVRKATRAELTRIGAHGLKPLLEALHDEKDPEQQRVAVAVLGHLGNRSAAPALVKLAKTEPKFEPVVVGVKPLTKIGTIGPGIEWELRVDALVAAGRLGDPSTFADVLALATHDEVAMREAAVFALGRMQDKRALPALLNALDDRRESVQALACLGLADQPDPRAVTAMAEALAEVRRHDLSRAACAYGLGVRNAAGSTAILTAALLDNRSETQRLAAWALGRIADKRALGPLLTAYFQRPRTLRDEVSWALGRVNGATLAAGETGLSGDYPLRAGKFDLAARVAGLLGPLPPLPVGMSIIASNRPEVVAALTAGLAADPDTVLRVLEDLDGSDAGLSLGTMGSPTADLSAIGTGIASAVAAHLTSSDPRTRAVALSVASKIADTTPNPNLDDAITAAASDAAVLVRATALKSLARVGRVRGVLSKSLTAVLATQLRAPGWQDRLNAAMAFASLASSPALRSQLDLAVVTALAADKSAFVRQAVAQALGALANAAGVPILITLSKDPVVEVRAAAVASLRVLGGPEANARLAEVANDSAESATVRAAATQR